MRTLELREVAQVISGQHILETDHNQLGRGIGYLTGPADFGLLQPTISRWTEKPKVLCKPGDILITVKGAGVGKVNLAPDTTVAIGRQLMAIRGNENAIDTNYLFTFLQTRLAHFQEKAVGATVPGLSREDLATLDIPYLPIENQRQIAARLKAQLAEVDKARQAAEAQLRELNFVLNQIIEEKILGVIAKGKTPMKLGEVSSISAKIVNPTLPEFCDLPHVSAENIESMTGRLIDIKSAKEDGMTSGKYLFDDGDILYSKLRPYLRKVAKPTFNQ